MLDPFKANLIIGLAILTYCNTPVAWQIVIGILDSLVKLRFQNNQRWKRPALYIDSMNNSYPFSIPQLYSPYIAPFLSPYNNFYNYNNPHLEANLVKIIEIVIKYPIFPNYILYKIKLTLYNNQVLALCLLIVIFPVIYYIKLRGALDKVYKPVFADSRQWSYFAAYKDNIRYILYNRYLGRESLYIKTKDILKKYFFFSRNQFIYYWLRIIS